MANSPSAPSLWRISRSFFGLSSSPVFLTDNLPPSHCAARRLLWPNSSRLPLLRFAKLPCLDSTDQLLKGLNAYRTSLKLSPLTENENAECLAEQIAKQLEDQPCSNTTGANTVPGTEEQFPNFPDFLTKCHLNATVTQDASIMPVCVPGLRSDLVLSNYTKTQYSGSLSDSKFIGAGLADEGDWVVVVLSTNTSTGSFSPATGSDSGFGSSSVHACALSIYLTVLFLELLVLMK